MTTISIILIILFYIQGVAWTAFAKFKHIAKYDNNNPRDFLNNLSGVAKRSYAAHQNSNEALPVFIGAIICANVSGVNPQQIHIIGSLILLTRVIYGVCYIKDKANMRSLVWGLSYLGKGILFILCIV